MSVVKYTGADVRDDRRLRPLAYEFLNQYTGDFPFLRDAKRLHMNGEYLRDGVIKGVLNCMLADPRVENMPEPTYKSFNPVNIPYEDDFNPKQVYPRRRYRQRLASSIIPVKFRTKYPFLTSDNNKALNIHILHENHEANWYRATDEIQARPRVMCGSRFPVSATLLGLYEALDLIVGGERKVCGTCERQADQSLISLLTAYESSLIREEDPLPESLTRADLPNP